MASLLILQRAAGNRAVAGYLAGARAPAVVQRCGSEVHPGCPCASESAEREDDPTVQDDAAPQNEVPVQRSPAYRPGNSWTQRGPNNAAGTCEPIGRIKAELAWQFASSKAPSGLSARCGCSRVGDAYTQFLNAGGGSFAATDPKDCINTQLAAEVDAHTDVETDLKTRLNAKIDDLSKANLSGKNEAKLPLIATLFGGGPQRLVSITYSRNDLAGGLLFGGGGLDEGAKDSEHGADTRKLSGEIILRRTDDKSDPTSMTVVPDLQLHYEVKDALDFCPGNTILKSKEKDPSGDYNEAITTLSNLEASGMARDVRLDAQYDRTVNLSPRKVAITPAPSPHAFPATGPATTSGSLLRVRSAPSLSAPTVRVLGARNTPITVTGQVRGDRVVGNSGTTDVWDRVDGGFVSHAYVDFAP